MSRVSLGSAALVASLAQHCHAVNVQQSAQQLAKAKQNPVETLKNLEEAAVNKVQEATGLDWNWEENACSCDKHCKSEKLLVVPEDPDRVTLYYGCSKKPGDPEDPGVGQCKQSGDPLQRVITSEDQVDIARFCRYTCKPVFESTPGGNHVCEHLDTSMIENARTASGGQDFMWQSTLMTDSNTFASIPPTPPTMSTLDALRKTYVKSLHGPPVLPEPEVTECMCDCADAALGETVVVETESAPLPAPPQPVMPQVFNKPAPPPAPPPPPPAALPLPRGPALPDIPAYVGIGEFLFPEMTNPIPGALLQTGAKTSKPKCPAERCDCLARLEGKAVTPGGHHVEQTKLVDLKPLDPEAAAAYGH